MTFKNKENGIDKYYNPIPSTSLLTSLCIVLVLNFYKIFILAVSMTLNRAYVPEIMR